jgi:hypothetical protein
VTFSHYVCWKPEALDLIETVAEEASHSMFLATHQPVRALRTEVGRDGEAHLANERDVLQVLEGKRSDPLIIPIIGASGSGKSHLVRWLHFHLRTSSKRHVIYVPRERTSLADVVELILDRIPHGHGDAELEHEVSELQASLKRASREMSEIELRRRLVENIAHSVLRLEPTKSPYQSARDADGWRFLVGGTGLPVLLGDPLYKDALSADGGVIARLAARITHGRAGDASGEEPLFGFDSLIIDVQNAGFMNRLARDAYDRFKQPGQRWLADIACDVLNHTLEDVAQETMGLSDSLGRPRISTIMIAVRRVLARQDMELVLLIEDLAVLHGIQKQLLEALITPRRRETEATDSDAKEASGELCQIRAAIAVTTGIWRQLEQSIDTLTRRLESWHTPLFNLDVPADAARDDDQDGGAYGREFVAGYLNAIRLGKDRLDAEQRDFDASPDGEPYRAISACSSCPHRGDCHPAFGHVGDRGFYPFNEQAVLRFVEVEARHSDGRFDPRRIVQGLQRMLDLAGRELPAGTFPGPDVRDYFVDTQTAMSASLAARLSRADAATGQRRRSLLELWGPRPYAVKNLDPAIHRAFDLPPLPEELLTADAEGEEEMTVDPEPKSQEVKVERVLNELERWGRDETTFDDRFAQTLRDWIFEAVLAQVDWEALSMGRTDDLLQEIGVPDASRCVSIQGSRGDTRSGAAGTLQFMVERSERSVRLLRSLFQLNRHGSWAFKDGEDGILVVADVTTPWVRDVEDRLRARGPTTGAIDSGYLTGMLAVTGMILGLNGFSPRRGIAEALSLALTPFDPDQDARSAAQSKEWQRVRAAAVAPPRGREFRETARQALLRRLGRTQGRGESIVALDVAEVIEGLRRVCEEWTPPEPTAEASPENRRWSEGVSNTLETAVNAEARRLGEWSKRASENIDLDVDASFDAVVVEIEAALNEIGRLGQGGSSDAFVRQAVQAAKELGEDDFRELVEFFSGDLSAAAWSERLAWVARDSSRITTTTDELIRQADSYFDLIERSLAQNSTARDGTGPLGQASEALAASLNELEQSLDAGRRTVKA